MTSTSPSPSGAKAGVCASKSPERCEQPAAVRPPDGTSGVVRDGARPEGPELGRERVVPVRPRDLLDEVDLTTHVVATKSRDAHMERAILLVHDLEAEGTQEALERYRRRTPRRAHARHVRGAARRCRASKGTGAQSRTGPSTAPPAVATISATHRSRAPGLPPGRRPARIDTRRRSTARAPSASREWTWARRAHTPTGRPPWPSSTSESSPPMTPATATGRSASQIMSMSPES